MPTSRESGLLSAVNLSERHKTVLVAIYFDGQTQAQVAQEIGCSQRWVSTLHAEALEKLTQAGLPIPKNKANIRSRPFDPKWLESRY